MQIFVCWLLRNSLSTRLSSAGKCIRIKLGAAFSVLWKAELGPVVTLPKKHADRDRALKLLPMLFENSYWKRPFLIIDFPTGLLGSATSCAEIIQGFTRSVEISTGRVGSKKCRLSQNCSLPEADETAKYGGGICRRDGPGR